MESSDDTYSELLQASLVCSDAPVEQPSFCMTVSESSESCICPDDAEEAASAKRAAQRAASAAEKAMRAAQMASAAAAETAACNSRSKRTAPKRAPPRQQREQYRADCNQCTDICDCEFEQGLDGVLCQLRSNMLAEYAKAKRCLQAQFQQQLSDLEERHVQEHYDLENEVARLRDLMSTFERSSSQKDQMIANLNAALKKEKGKVNKLKRQMDDLQGKDDERERKARSAQEREDAAREEWRKRIETACQNKAQEVNERLKRDYDIRIDQLLEELEKCREEIEMWRCRRSVYEENVKQALMRGVCALNMETMNVLDNPADEIDECNRRREEARAHRAHPSNHGQGPSVRFSFPEGAPAPRQRVPQPRESSYSHTSTSSSRRTTTKRPVTVERHSHSKHVQ